MITRLDEGCFLQGGKTLVGCSGISCHRVLINFFTPEFHSILQPSAGKMNEVPGTVKNRSMAKPITFILSDDSVNSYGFRVMTDGIDTTQFEKNSVMFYMHDRGVIRPSGDEVIGRWENIRKENGELLADPVFDEENEFSAKIAKKVKAGFLKAASIGFDLAGSVISEDPKDMLPGQTGPTIMKLKLKEASIVDIGSNDSALKLYDDAGQAINLASGLKQLIPTNPNNMKELQTIALALGLKEDAPAAEIVAKIQKVLAERDDATAKLGDFKKAQDDANKQEADTLIQEAKDLGVLSDELSESYTRLFELDHASTKATLSDMISKHKESQSGRQEAAGKLMDGIGKGSNAEAPGEQKDFGWYEKQGSTALADLRSNQPDQFVKLFNEHYGTNFATVDEIR